ncbi:uncharacterized protein DUF922 [Ulvibacter sp. MAR_2010_11]|uniref:DUF922 domain-containing protein n=1 Tax=Ulvibacter sp. MAR_2010_11 TaxID=1250229 RepID=UPI000C2BC563|nr:DUF922 domain-containing protein [Ulvibacter sp. MAR_2010_11]PKA83720.1 uncharacterized protein DUF922 [Ulvibacter sp. MAR_2010_11]
MKLLIALFFISLMTFSSENNTEKIAWSEDYKLSWADFQGIPNGGSSFVASTNSGMSFSFSYGSKNGVIEYDFTIESNFYPKLSWYRRGAVSDYILQHEQTHFDISELHTRIFRKRMEEATFSGKIKAEVYALYEKTEAERKEMQRRYDEETNHSQIQASEAAWQIFVAKQLREYGRWK